ncbi:unnamed protein product [Gongylonema pulchrum]|uniref:Tudor domain-containing protein n=1 Tax=Gongylonema pulchrum TaxID=637853 RepID=A0A183DPW3_9BILA|nr:unnamed protein product [Gongylonema pulchrum]
MIAPARLINGCYVDGAKILETPRIGDVAFANFDGAPFRAEIVDIEKNDDGELMYRLRFVDYGNESVCKKEEILAMDRDQQTKGIQPIDGDNWSEEAQKYVDLAMAPYTFFDAIVGSPSTNDVHPIRKNDDGELMYRLRFVDYGNESICKKEEILAVDKDQQTKGIQPIDGDNWSEEAQKYVDSAMAPYTFFDAIVGSPSTNDVHPIKALVPKAVLTKEDGDSGDVNDSEQADNENNNENKVDLAEWMLSKGCAKLTTSWSSYPLINLLADGKREYEMIFTEVNGQSIRALPCDFSDLATKMKMALRNIKTATLNSEASVGLITVNDEYKRAMVVPPPTSDSDIQPKKCVLVDDGITVECSENLCGIDGLGGTDGFLIRTCHQMSVQLQFDSDAVVLDADLEEALLASDSPAKVILSEYKMDGTYIVNEITLANGTTVKAKCLEAEINSVEMGSQEELLECEQTQSSGDSLLQAYRHSVTSNSHPQTADSCFISQCGKVFRFSFGGWSDEDGKDNVRNVEIVEKMNMGRSTDDGKVTGAFVTSVSSEPSATIIETEQHQLMEENGTFSKPEMATTDDGEEKEQEEQVELKLGHVSKATFDEQEDKASRSESEDVEKHSRTTTEDEREQGRGSVQKGCDRGDGHETFSERTFQAIIKFETETLLLIMLRFASADESDTGTDSDANVRSTTMVSAPECLATSVVDQAAAARDGENCAADPALPSEKPKIQLKASEIIAITESGVFDNAHDDDKMSEPEIGALLDSLTMRPAETEDSE